MTDNKHYPAFECFDEFRKWLCEQYEFYLRDKEVWHLLTDYGYNGDEIAILLEFYTNFQYMQKCVGIEPDKLRRMLNEFIHGLK